MSSSCRRATSRRCRRTSSCRMAATLLLQFTGSDDVKLKMETIRFGRGLGLSTQKHRLAR